jgi:two-component system, cell cycle sensor histidine kinase and response regulator CckA
MVPESTHCKKFEVLRRQLDLADAGARFFSDLFERAPEAMVVIDTTGRVMMANAAACHLHAVDQTELVRLRLQDLLPRELDLSSAAERLRDFGQASLEFCETGKDGQLIDMRLEARLFQAGRYLVTFRDISREKRFEREIERAHEHRTFAEAAAAVVHDVNNLLMPILCYSDLLALRQPADEELQRSVAEIRDAAERAALLARKLLSLAELTAEKPRVVGMNEVLFHMKEVLSRLVGSRVELSFRFDPSLGAIEVDLERFQRLVLNLVLNARDAMPKGGALVIETHADSRDVKPAPGGRAGARRYAVLCVSDTGVGMDVATRERIFEPFFTTKSGQGGTGLGLAMVLSFVSRNHGFVDVDSRPGGGTTFRVAFPVVHAGTSAGH